MQGLDNHVLPGRCTFLRYYDLFVFKHIVRNLRNWKCGKDTPTLPNCRTAYVRVAGKSENGLVWQQNMAASVRSEQQKKSRP
jgi:hypothetical protein